MNQPIRAAIRGELYGFLCAFMPWRFRKVTSMVSNAKWYLTARYAECHSVWDRGFLLPEQLEAIEILAQSERLAQFGAAVPREANL